MVVLFRCKSAGEQRKGGSIAQVHPTIHPGGQRKEIGYANKRKEGVLSVK